MIGLGCVLWQRQDSERINIIGHLPQANVVNTNISKDLLIQC